MYFLGSTILCEKAVLPLHLILHLQINFLYFDKLPNLNSVLFSKNNLGHWKNNTENNVQSSIFYREWHSGNNNYTIFLISIHTPTQGVTSLQYPFCLFPEISIHTPTQGVTFCKCSFIWHYKNFNPHSHAGSDSTSFLSASVFMISIHTPTQGVTSVSIIGHRDGYNFNPHSHAGSDLQYRSLHQTE